MNDKVLIEIDTCRRTIKRLEECFDLNEKMFAGFRHYDAIRYATDHKIEYRNRLSNAVSAYKKEVGLIMQKLIDEEKENIKSLMLQYLVSKEEK